ncbi:MAG: peptide ABC transporter substrate-binding protein [Alphaproteobacteria bacterium]|nr:peptide ABC transporter substrate-binding protein [Alphaproteobacteria bacterium]
MRLTFLPLSMLLIALTLSACDSGGETNVLRRGNGAEPESLDPHLAEGHWENNIIGEMLMGLFTEDAASEPMLGAAESYSVSDDGLVWIFTIRDHKWSDGEPVTADDFVFAWRRILDPATAAKYSSILYLFKNAKAVSAGTMPPEALGARAIDAKTLELSLEHPAPYLPQLLMHHTAYPLPKHVVEAKGDDWVKAGNYVANGPYLLAEWRPNDVVRLVKNEVFYDAAAVSIAEVDFYPTEDPSAAFKRFRAGELDMQSRLSSQDLDTVRAEIPETLREDLALTLSYVAINVTKPPLDDRRVREALNLAYDRETIGTRVLAFNDEPAYSIVPPGTAGTTGKARMSFKDMPQEARIARAQALMSEAGFGPENRLKLRLEQGNSPDAKRVAAAVQDMFKAIYIDVELRASEAKTLYVYLQEGDFELGGAGWILDYNDAENILFLFETDTEGFNYGRWSSPQFDVLMGQAKRTAEGARRAELLEEAEQLILDDYAIIPTRFPKNRNLVQTYVKGFQGNLRDTYRTRWLRLEREAS